MSESSIRSGEALATAPSMPVATTAHTLPASTWSPAALAFGVTLLAWGLITSVTVLLIGATVSAAALTTWIKEIRDGSHGT